jgi:DNA-binding response OmpR family regulator
MIDGLSAMTLREQVEHLTFALQEITGGDVAEVDGYPGVHFSPHEARVLNAIKSRCPRIAPHSALYAAVTWDRSAEPDPEIVKVHVSRIRRKLRSAGYDNPIKNEHGLGYRWIG